MSSTAAGPEVEAHRQRRVPDRLLARVRGVAHRVHRRMPAPDLEELGAAPVLKGLGAESPLEVRVVDERDAALLEDPCDAPLERLRDARHRRATDTRALAEGVHVHRHLVRPKGDLLGRDDHEARSLELAVRVRIGEAVVIREGEEVVSVVAIPRVDGLGRREVAVALRRVRVEIAALEHRDGHRPTRRTAPVCPSARTPPAAAAAPALRTRCPRRRERPPPTGRLRCTQ